MYKKKLIKDTLNSLESHLKHKINDVASFSLIAATADTETVLYKLRIELNLSDTKLEFNGQENSLA